MLPWRTSFGGLFVPTFFFLVGSRDGAGSLRHLRQIQERKKRKKKNKPTNANMKVPLFDPLIGLLGLVFSSPHPPDQLHGHGWTGLAGLIILAHRYSSPYPYNRGTQWVRLETRQWEMAKSLSTISQVACPWDGRAGRSPNTHAPGPWKPILSPLRTWRRKRRHSRDHFV